MALSHRTDAPGRAARRLPAAYRHAPLGHPRPQPQLLAAAMDVLGGGLIACDREARIIHANRAAQAFGVGCSGARIEGLGATGARRLLELIVAAVDQGLSGGLCVHGQAGQRTLIVVSPMSQQVGLALVAIDSDDEPRGPSAGMLRQMFDLTPAEAELAVQLLGRQSLSQIRAERGVSENTVRTQLAHIFSKTGVASQRELVRLLSQIPTLS